MHVELTPNKSTLIMPLGIVVLEGSNLILYPDRT